MKRIEIDERAYAGFLDLPGSDSSKKLRKLIELGERQQDEIASVVLEDVLFQFGDNRGQVSVAPFFDGLVRFFDNVRIYRLNFYDASSFAQALDNAMSVSESRVILYVGAHGSKGRIASANARTIASQIAKAAKDKLEGIILSSCETGSNDDTLEKMLEGRANWVFGYSNSVHILSSMLLETAILKQVFCAESDYIDTQEGIVETFSKALGCFNPAWHFGDDEMPMSVRLQVRPKQKQKSIDATLDLVQAAWQFDKTE